MKKLLCILLAFGSIVVIAASEALPPAAQDLIKKRQQAVARIDEKLNGELEKVKTQCMKNGDLEGANAIDAAIKDTSKLPVNDGSDPLINSVWNFLGNRRQKINEFEFLKGGKVKCNNYKDATWKRLSKNAILFAYSPEGGFIVFVIDEQGKNMSGVHSPGVDRYLQKVR